MKNRVFSGARPTGRQHIGNYLGAIENYVKLQDEFECVYCIVDIHALTTLEDLGQMQYNIREMMLDWLGETESAQRVEDAVATVISEGAVQTYDMGGTATTLEMAEAIAGKL